MLPSLSLFSEFLISSSRGCKLVSSKNKLLLLVLFLHCLMFCTELFKWSINEMNNVLCSFFFFSFNFLCWCCCPVFFFFPVLLNTNSLSRTLCCLSAAAHQQAVLGPHLFILIWMAHPADFLMRFDQPSLFQQSQWARKNSKKLDDLFTAEWNRIGIRINGIGII